MTMNSKTIYAIVLASIGFSFPWFVAFWMMFGVFFMVGFAAAILTICWWIVPIFIVIKAGRYVLMSEPLEPWWSPSGWIDYLMECDLDITLPIKYYFTWIDWACTHRYNWQPTWVWHELEEYKETWTGAVIANTISFVDVVEDPTSAMHGQMEEFAKRHRAAKAARKKWDDEHEDPDPVEVVFGGKPDLPDPETHGGLAYMSLLVRGLFHEVPMTPANRTQVFNTCSRVLKEEMELTVEQMARVLRPIVETVFLKCREERLLVASRSARGYNSGYHWQQK